MKPINESQIQQNICQYLSLISYQTGIVFFSVPNEGIMSVLMSFKVDKITCIKIVEHFKKMGLLPGTSDIVIIHKGLAYCLEVKKLGAKQSKDQILFMRNVIAAGGKYEIVHSLYEAEKQVKEWGIL